MGSQPPGNGLFPALPTGPRTAGFLTAPLLTATAQHNLCVSWFPRLEQELADTHGTELLGRCRGSSTGKASLEDDNDKELALRTCQEGLKAREAGEASGLPCPPASPQSSQALGEPHNPFWVNVSHKLLTSTRLGMQFLLLGGRQRVPGPEPWDTSPDAWHVWSTPL